MAKEQVVEEFEQIPGVGPKAAEALYAAGLRSLSEVQAASRERLEGVEGLAPKAIEAILAWQAEQRGEALPAKQEIEVVEEAAPKPAEAREEVQIVEPEERVHAARAKPALAPELREALRVRRVLATHRPRFRHDQWFRYKKLSRVGWRKPRGARNKVRLDMAYRPRRPVVGYRGPAASRGLHSSGFEEVLVHRPEDLEGLDAARQAARVAAKVGARKRAAILEAAQKKGIRVLNPGRPGRGVPG